MKQKFLAVFFFIMLFWVFASAQHSVTVISPCGGSETVLIPNITDNDSDGMDDVLEQKLLDHFTPVIIQFNDESCPGPALDGSGDSNLVACHIYAYPPQYTFSASPDSVLIHPTALVPPKGLTVGMIWYPALIKINAAVLYGKDCGLLGHTADVEGFNYSLKYIGTDSLAGWRYDTIMSHWAGATIQTISHAGTPCQQIETQTYLPATGKDTVYASPDKHGNYLTIGGCNASIICNPGCNGTPEVKAVKPINLGEPGSPLITDLGNDYSGYSGEDPWSTNKFLASDGGDAGTIRDKMLLPLSTDFLRAFPLNNQAQICAIYQQCYGLSASSLSDYICAGNPYHFYGQNLWNSGIYYDTLSNSYGCDSLITLYLSVLNPDHNTFSVSTCSDTFLFNGIPLTSSGIYTDTLSNHSGCDSILLLHLTLNHSSGYSYTVSICEGESYNFNGQIITQPGVYSDTLNNSSNCDSIASLDLLIDSLPQPYWNTLNDTLYSDGHPILLTGGSPAGGTYSGPGIHGNIFSPDSVNPGTYTLYYTVSNATGCTKSVSHVIVVLISGIKSITADPDIKIYPNPGNDRMIAYGGNWFREHAIEVTVWNITGQKIHLPYEHEGDNIILHTFRLTPGIYSVVFTSPNRRVQKRIVIEK